LTKDKRIKNHIDGAMASEFASSALNRLFEPRSGYAKYYEICICFFSAKHTSLTRKSKDLLARIQDNVSEWGNISIGELLFRWASTITVQLSVQYKADLIISLKINLFSPWYSCKIRAKQQSLTERIKKDTASHEWEFFLHIQYTTQNTEWHLWGYTSTHFCRSLFVLLYVFFWTLCCLFFLDLRILMTSLVSSNSSSCWTPVYVNEYKYLK
jgi:hypothetical protein